MYGSFAQVGKWEIVTFFCIRRVLSGVLHVDEKHAHFSKDEISQIRRDLLKIFYTKEQQERDLIRAQAARGHWAAWYEVGGRFFVLPISA